VHNPALFAGRQSLSEITSHADLLPTLLGLAGLDVSKIQGELKKTHTEVNPLVGRDLSGVILGEEPSADISGPVYFLNEDEISRGSKQVSALGHEYRPVLQPTTLETVITYLPTGAGREKEKWKYSRYSDNPQFWSDPGEPRDVMTIVYGNVNQAGQKTATTTVKTQPAPDQAECYNLARDPLELDNLVHTSDPSVQATIKLLERLLHQQCAEKMLKPSSGTVPGQPDC
jgi:arylsulfatase A-like enzyme